MAQYLSEKEKFVLDFIKEDYDKKGSNPLHTIDPKVGLKTSEDIPALLQEKGYIEITKTDLDPHLEMISITLKNKFFEYFNIG